jgi:hypothetical protein
LIERKEKTLRRISQNSNEDGRVAKGERRENESGID